MGKLTRRKRLAPFSAKSQSDWTFSPEIDLVHHCPLHSSTGWDLQSEPIPAFLSSVAKKSNGKMWAEFVRNGGTAGRAAAGPQRIDRRPIDGIILGVDPSLRGTGVAVLKTQGKQATLLHSEVFRFPPIHKTESCIGEISRRIDRILQDFTIKVAAIEEAIYVQNYRTALTLGAARGSAIAAMVLRGVEINEYPPLRIKQAVVGYGRASKEQLRRTLTQMVSGVTEEISLDESDAVATAMCHWLTSQRQLPVG